jgi:Flp pilus assembly protein TadD
MSNKNYEIGIAFLDNGDYKKAIDFLTKSIEEDPDDSEAYENRSYAYYYLQDDINSLKDLDKAIELDPNNENALHNRGLYYSTTGDGEAAERDFLAAYNIYNENIRTLEQLAHLGLYKKDFDFAEKFVKEILLLDPDNYWGLRDSVDIAFHRKEYERAIALITKVQKLYKGSKTLPNLDKEMYNYLGYIYMKLGELEQSEFYYKSALTEDPEYAYPIDNLGHLEYLRKNYHKAKELINRSIDIDPSNSYAFKSRALVYIAEGNKDAAFEDLKHAETLGFQDYWGEEVEELLKEHFPND